MINFPSKTEVVIFLGILVSFGIVLGVGLTLLIQYLF